MVERRKEKERIENEVENRKPRTFAVRERIIPGSVKETAERVYKAIPAKPYIMTAGAVTAFSYLEWGAQAAEVVGGFSALFLVLSKVKKRKWWKYALLGGIAGALFFNPMPLALASAAIVLDLIWLSKHTKTGLNEKRHDDDHFPPMHH